MEESVKLIHKLDKKLDIFANKMASFGACHKYELGKDECQTYHKMKILNCADCWLIWCEKEYHSQERLLGI